MHPWMKIFSEYLAKHFPGVENTLRDAISIVQAYCDQNDIATVDEACQLLQLCSFTTISELLSQDQIICCNLTNNLNYRSTTEVNLNKDAYINNLDSNKSINESSSATPNNVFSDSRCKSNSERNNRRYILLSILVYDESSKTGTLCLKDESGIIPCVCSTFNITHLNKKIILFNWRLIRASIPDNSLTVSIKNMKKDFMIYLEVQDFVISPSNENSNLVETDKSKLGLTNISTYMLKSRNFKSINLRGCVIAKSPVHKLRGCTSFFMLLLQCTENSNYKIPIIIQGNSYAYWHTFIYLFSTIGLTNVKVTLMNKGSKEERKVLCTSKVSEIQIEKNSGTAGDAIKMNSPEPSNLINYIGFITDTNDAEFGIYCLDEQVKLLICHQPCLQLGRGLRIGARLHVCNAHKVNLNDEIVLCCCTISSVEILNLSEEISFFNPIISQLHPIVSVCQDIPLKEYIWIVQSTKKIRSCLLSLGCIICEEVNRNLAKALIAFIDSSRVKRSIFNEFLDTPHICVFTKKCFQEIKLPLYKTLKDIVELHDNLETIEWLDGREFDKYAKNDDERWKYTVIHVRQHGTCGVVKQCGKYLFIDNGNHYLNIVSCELSEGDVILMKNFLYVIEKYIYHEVNKNSGKISKKVFTRSYIMLSPNCNDIIHLKEKNIESVDQTVKKQRTELDTCQLSCSCDINGIILSREFKRPTGRNFDVETHPNEHIYVPSIGRIPTYQIVSSHQSLYPFTTSVLVVRIIDDVTKKHSVIYLDSNKIYYPLGLFPGSSVKFSKLEKKTGKNGSIYYKMNVHSAVEIIKPPPLKLDDLYDLINKTQSEVIDKHQRISLVTLYEKENVKAYGTLLVLARISMVQSITCCWKCKECHSNSIENYCSTGCNGGKRFYLESRCVVDDGTAECYLHMDEEDVKKLLQFTSTEYQLIKTTSFKDGLLSYHNTSVGIEKNSENLKNRSMKQQCEILLEKKVAISSIYRYHRFFCKKFKRIDSSGYRTISITCNQTEYHTLAQTKISLQSIEFEKIDYANHILNSI